VPDTHQGFERAEEIVHAFNDCEFARLLGIEIVEIWSGGARAVMETPGKANLMGIAHGGAVFALADHVFGVAANAGGAAQIAISAHIRYLAPATGRLEAVARRVSETDRFSVFEVLVYAGDRLAASFEGVGLKI